MASVRWPVVASRTTVLVRLRLVAEGIFEEAERVTSRVEEDDQAGVVGILVW